MALAISRKTASVKPFLIKLSVDYFALGLCLFSSGKKQSQVFQLIEPLHLDITSNKNTFVLKYSIMLLKPIHHRLSPVNRPLREIICVPLISGHGLSS